ncbi:MAG: zf-HC2 domain-containing protein [Candidatus Marinimicrobia bacterium]|nr:zf-HC2 domain-containing protein [Candidatus Neomarinimicrobiota bacterium]
MNCKKVSILIPLYALGECSDRDKNIVLDHIKTCSKCNSFYSDIKKIYSSIRIEEKPDLPDIGAEIVFNVNSKINKLEKRKKMIGRIVPSISLLIALIFTVGILTINNLSFIGFKKGNMNTTYEILKEINDYSFYNLIINSDESIVDQINNIDEIKKEFILYTITYPSGYEESNIINAMKDEEFEHFAKQLYAGSL